MAVLGAGVSDADTWIDITGTWEILIATVDAFHPAQEHHANGLDFECHAIPGQWICQSLMIAGAVTEWVRANFYRDVLDDSAYATMFTEAEAPSNGVYLLPAFMRGMGPDASKHALGTILGLQTMTARGQIVRAALEGLCFQLRKQITAIESAVGHAPKRLRVVGGGQKNPLWLQLKADITGLPVEITTNPEVTLLGTAMLAGVGAGLYRDMDEALRHVAFSAEEFLPRMDEHRAYSDCFNRVYAPLPSLLAPAYGKVERLI
jgi:xylulokinase